METLFVFLSNMLVCNKKLTYCIYNLSRLDFNHFILLHSKLSQFHIHVKINSQEYSNLIPRAFEPMITHQV